MYLPYCMQMYDVTHKHTHTHTERERRRGVCVCMWPNLVCVCVYMKVTGELDTASVSVFQWFTSYRGKDFDTMRCYVEVEQHL